MDRLLTFQFAQPWWLVLLLLVPLRTWLRGKPGQAAGLPYSSVAIVRQIGGVVRRNPGHWHRLLENVAFALLIVALACPRMEKGNSNDSKEGIDIVFCVDTSGSMGGGVIYHNNTITKGEALRQAIDEFVDSRPNDRFWHDRLCLRHLADEPVDPGRRLDQKRASEQEEIPGRLDG